MTIDPKKTVDPEKEEKKSKKAKVLVEEKSGAENYLLIKGELIKATEAEPVEEAPKKEGKTVQPASQDGEDVQSFNFLYYIIHQFKFSDFITQ